MTPESKTPISYAVVNDQGYFVGIWANEEIAKNVCAKGQPSHNQQVVPMCEAQLLAQAIKERDELNETLSSLPAEARKLLELVEAVNITLKAIHEFGNENPNCLAEAFDLLDERYRNLRGDRK